MTIWKTFFLSLQTIFSDIIIRTSDLKEKKKISWSFPQWRGCSPVLFSKLKCFMWYANVSLFGGFTKPVGACNRKVQLRIIDINIFTHKVHLLCDNYVICIKVLHYPLQTMFMYCHLFICSNHVTFSRKHAKSLKVQEDQMELLKHRWSLKAWKFAFRDIPPLLCISMPMHTILGWGSFCMNYCLNVVWYGGDQPVVMLRCSGNSNCFDSSWWVLCLSSSSW